VAFKLLTHSSSCNDRPLLRMSKWLRAAFALLMMAYSLAFGLIVGGRGLAHLPDTIRSGDLPSALGVVLVVSLCVAAAREARRRCI
jgi:hypothetical protein